MLGWTKLKLELRLLGEISKISDMQMTPPLWQKSEEESEKVDLKLKKQKKNTKMKLWHPVPSLDGK